MGRIRNNKNAPFEILKYKELITNKTKYFSNNNPIALEIGCGKGNFIITNAMKFNHMNFIGVEMFPTILLKAIKKNSELQLSNLRFLCSNATELMNYFEKSSISIIYLNFSDP